ncbi:MAG: efflux RND transporter periplasmic adaptor subunit [Myxococcales bacterium]|nr:efflux RND transporter periplasmic adaptor subunit [Myxococcales bacterium]
MSTPLPPKEDAPSPPPGDEVSPPRAKEDASPEIDLEAPARTVGAKLRVALGVLLIVGAAGGIGYWLMQTGPRARKKRRRAKVTWLVHTQPVKVAEHHARIIARGTVMAARTVDLRARVAGSVVWLSKEMLPGGRFKKGDVIARLDPRDYTLAIEQRRAAVVQARTALALERGQQAIARRGYKLLGKAIAEKDRGLVLRKPQLDNARATLQAAEALLAQARLDLSRTVIRAPFNAAIKTRQVSVGTQVTALTSLGELVGTDSYWVELTVPVHQLRFLSIPGRDGETGSPARVYHSSAWGRGAYRDARILRLASDLEAKGRMARLLLAIDDPLLLAAKKPLAGAPRRLLIGAYVRAEIRGASLGRVAMIPARALRDGDTVWLVSPQKTLLMRRVRVLLRDQDHVYVHAADLRAGDTLVDSDITSPVEGMPLRLAAAKKP